MPQLRTFTPSNRYSHFRPGLDIPGAPLKDGNAAKLVIHNASVNPAAAKNIDYNFHTIRRAG